MAKHLASTADLVYKGFAGYAKAISAAVAAAAALFIDAIADGSVTSAEWKSVAIGAVTAGVTTYFVPNAVKGLKSGVTAAPVVPPVD